MFSKYIAGLVAAGASLVSAQSGTHSMTPHEQYSSSVGVLGCYINTNRVAYWPGAVDCNNICVRVSYGGRSVHLLKIDSSGGAYDISYDAWNYLGFGVGAKESPRTGGGINMQYQFVSADNCRSLMRDGKLHFTAANSVNFVDSCIRQNSWVGRNYQFINLLDPVCKYGWNERCTYNGAVSNQPQCPHTLGEPRTPTGQRVVNIAYGTGREYVA